MESGGKDAADAAARASGSTRCSPESSSASSSSSPRSRFAPSFRRSSGASFSPSPPRRSMATSRGACGIAPISLPSRPASSWSSSSSSRRSASPARSSPTRRGFSTGCIRPRPGSFTAAPDSVRNLPVVGPTLSDNWELISQEGNSYVAHFKADIEEWLVWALQEMETLGVFVFEFALAIIFAAVFLGNQERLSEFANIFFDRIGGQRRGPPPRQGRRYDAQHRPRRRRQRPRRGARRDRSSTSSPASPPGSFSAV